MEHDSETILLITYCFVAQLGNMFNNDALDVPLTSVGVPTNYSSAIPSKMMSIFSNSKLCNCTNNL